MKTENFSVVELSSSEKAETTGGFLLGFFILAVIVGYLIGSEQN